MQHAEAEAAAQSEADLQRSLKAAKLRAIEKLLWGSFRRPSSRKADGACPQGVLARAEYAGRLQSPDLPHTVYTRLGPKVPKLAEQ